MNHGMSKSILISSLLALGIAMSLPAGSQTGGAGAGSTGAGQGSAGQGSAGQGSASDQGSSAGQGGATGQGSAAGSAASAGGQGSNAPAQGGAVGSAVQTPGSQQATAGTTSSSTTAAASTGTTTTEPLASSDEKFVSKAVKDNLAEVKLGQLAVAKAQTPEVKEFGQRMIDDHMAASEKLMQLASAKGLQSQRELELSAQHEYNTLNKLSGAQFDREYMNHMVADHQKDIKEFEKVAQSAKDPDLKEFVDSTLPTLRDHLANAKSAQAAAKNGKTTASRS